MREVIEVEAIEIREVVYDGDKCADCNLAAIQGKMLEGVLKCQRCPNLSDRFKAPGRQEQVSKSG